MVETKRKKRYTRRRSRRAAVEMYLSGPNSMRAVARRPGNECQHPEPFGPSDTAPAIRRMNDEPATT